MSTKGMDKGRTLSTVLTGRQDALLAAWIKNILDLPGNRTLSLMTESQLRDQTRELLESLLDAFKSGNYKDIHTPEYETAVYLLRMISSSRAEQGFTPTETAVFVFSFKDSALPILQEAFDSDPALLAREVTRLNTVIDKLGLVTFESYTETREKVINEQSRAMVELAEASSKSKNLFLASMSHEIRTPIQAITGMGELLRESALPQEERTYIDIINRAGETLLALVNDVLDLSKIEAGQFELDQRPMSLEKVIENSVSILAHRARDKGLKLTWKVEDEVPKSITGDFYRLRQMLLNLIGNAIKFTSSGEIGIRAKTQNGNLLVSVRDTGIGVAEEFRKIIFEPFCQSDSATSRQYGGTGLGLAICRQFVEKMGGQIRLESEVGEGSTFFLEWPMNLFKANKHQKNSISHPASHGNPIDQSSIQSSSRRILLAEDTPEVRLVIKAFLKKTPWRIDVAKDGADAMIKFISNTYDLVLMDVEMPIMNGYAATQAIRGWECQHGRSRTPVLALTAHAMREYRERCLEAGCDGHIIKPVSKDSLIQSIHMALEQEPLRKKTA